MCISNHIFYVIFYYYHQSYWPFLFFRAAMGFGQAGFSVIAPTMLVDLFFGKQATVAIALYCFCTPVGGWVGLCYSFLPTSFKFDNSRL